MAAMRNPHREYTHHSGTESRRISALHSAIRCADFAAVSAIAERDLDILWEPNSAGWTALHVAASVILPVDLWKWILSHASHRPQIFFSALTQTGVTCLETFFRTQVLPLPWQNLEIKIRAKELKESIDIVISNADYLNLLASFILDDSIELCDNTWITNCFYFWMFLEPLRSSAIGQDTSILTFLSKTGCCPREISQLFIALELLKTDCEPRFGEVLVSWASTCSSNIDGMLEPLLHACPNSPFFTEKESGRHPSHFALLNGKRMTDLMLLFKAAPMLVQVVDPVTRLPWVGLVAISKEYPALIRAQRRVAGTSGLDSMFRLLSPSKQANRLTAAKEELNIERLNAIFTILRLYPSSLPSGARSAFQTAKPNSQPSRTALKDADAAVMLGGVPQEAILAAGAVAVAGVAGIFAGGKGEASSKSASPTEPEPEPIDVSIPYNAAAMMEFKKAKSGASFKEFEELYIQKIVADVTAKKVKRDVEATVKQAEAAASKAASEFDAKFG